MKQKNWYKYIFIIFQFVLLNTCEQNASFSKPVIENQIRGLLNLPTVEFVYRDIIYVGQEASFFGIKHLDKRLLFSVDLKINAGVDLTKGVEIRNLEDGGLQISLSEPEILEVDADEGSIHQFFVKEWGGKVSRLDYYDEIVKSKNSIKIDAVKRNILLKAKENTEDIIVKLFSVYGITNVSFMWRDFSAR